MTGMIVISVICISCAFLLWHIADRRGANTRLWSILGAVFGPLAIPFVFLTKNKASPIAMFDGHWNGRNQEGKPDKTARKQHGKKDSRPPE